MSLAIDWFQIAFAGLWAEVWRYGLGGGIIICLLAAAYFSPILKKEFCWAAGVVGAFLIAFTIGVSTGEKRVQAQWDAAVKASVKQGNNARSDAERDIERLPAGGVRSGDRFDRDNH